jgi:hypothetical protein
VSYPPGKLNSPTFLPTFLFLFSHQTSNLTPYLRNHPHNKGSAFTSYHYNYPTIIYYHRDPTCSCDSILILHIEFSATSSGHTWNWSYNSNSTHAPPFHHLILKSSSRRRTLRRIRETHREPITNFTTSRKSIIEFPINRTFSSALKAPALDGSAFGVGKDTGNSFSAKL